MLFLMVWRPTRSTPTTTRLPVTTLFRTSPDRRGACRRRWRDQRPDKRRHQPTGSRRSGARIGSGSLFLPSTFEVLQASERRERQRRVGVRMSEQIEDDGRGEGREIGRGSWRERVCQYG